MADKNLFQTISGMFTPKADTINEAGGTAITFDFSNCRRTIRRTKQKAD